MYVRKTNLVTDNRRWPRVKDIFTTTIEMNFEIYFN